MMSRFPGAAVERADSQRVREASAKPTCEEEVSRLFEEARDDVYRYLLTLGLYPPQAQEAAQEVFLKLYVELKKGGQIENVRAWIFRVAHNHGVRLRSREDLIRPFDPEVEIDFPDVKENPERSMLERERWTRFHEAVDNLSPQQRNCLYLRAEGFRYREIAEILEISDSSVSEFLRRAIGRLRKALHV